MFKEQSLNVLQQQYGYTNVSDLMMRKAAVWDKYMGNISDRFVSEILNFDTCIPSALDYYWGRILKISRTFDDGNGNTFSLTDDQFRKVLKIRAFGTNWDGTVSTMNTFLKNIFGSKGDVYMWDRQNMSVQIYVFTFLLEDWEKYLYVNKDIFPRPAGIETAIYEIQTGKLFGFINTANNWQPFNEGVLWNGQTLYN